MSKVESAPDLVQPLSTDFGGLSIAYDDRVLTPRRWTAMQSYWAAELLRDSPPGRVLELCAGAGHIGLLTVALAPRDLVMVDVNPHACDFARRNADANRLVASVDVRHHIEEEEQEWFPKVREGLGRKRLQEIGAEMLEAKKKAPRRPSQPSALKKTVDAVIK